MYKIGKIKTLTVTHLPAKLGHQSILQEVYYVFQWLHLICLNFFCFIINNKLEIYTVEEQITINNVKHLTGRGWGVFIQRISLCVKRNFGLQL
jgi:hypothetical protein